MTRTMSRVRLFLVGIMAVLFVCSGFMAVPANATESGDGSITIRYQYGGQSVADSAFYLYKVANWDENEPDVPLSESVTSGFSIPELADVNWKLLDSESAEDWSDLTATLFNDLKLHEFDIVDPVADGSTDSDGVVRFDKLTDGVYLAISPLSALPKAVYSAQLISIPSKINPTTAENRDVEITAKGNAWNGEDPIHVKKVWEDGDSANRPKSIEVTLYYQYGEDESFEPYETVTLNAANNWSYEWTQLPESMDYVVRETNVPEGYSMSMTVDRVSDTTSYWTFTNTADDQDKPGTPGTPGKPSSQSNPVNPAFTGSNIALIVFIAAGALGLGVILMVEVRKMRKAERE